MAAAAAPPPAAPIGLIAGSGRFPLLIAREAARQGRPVIAFGVKGWVDAGLASQVTSYEELEVGAVATLLARLQARGVRHVILAGKVTKQALLQPAEVFDAQARALLTAAPDASVNALLGQLGRLLAVAGITLLDSSTFLEALLCPIGVVTARAPSLAEQADVQAGLGVARTLAALDVGQTVVVKQRVVVAVEALEGTDATIRRAREVAGPGLVVVKAASPAQDRRFDLPVLGCATIDVCRQAGVSCLAVQARLTLLLDKDDLITRADAAGLCVLGVDPTAS